LSKSPIIQHPKLKIQNSKFKIHLTYSFIFLALWFISVPSTAIAQDVTFVPSIDIRGEYDNNVLFSRVYKTKDFLTTVKPAFTWDYATELLDLKSNAAVDIFRYMDETDLDTENQNYGLDGKYQIAERLSLSGNCSYVKDTTLESELAQTGLLSPRQERKRYGGGGGFTYQISEISDVVVDYSHSKTDYEFESSMDNDFDSIALSFNHRLGNQLDMLTFRPYYSWYDGTRINNYILSVLSKQNLFNNNPVLSQVKVNNYGFSFGWFHPFSETFSITAFGGVRYTKNKYIYCERLFETFDDIFNLRFNKLDLTDSNWGGTADISLKKTGETYTTSLGYNRDLSYTSTGEPIDTDNIHFGVDKRLTERLGANLSGSLYFTKSQGTNNATNERYFSISPSLYYNLTEYHSLSLGYNYEQSLNKILVTDQKADRNRVWLALQFKFPL
jgi:hypothetical protein